MIHEIQARNFQSLRSVAVKLGKFTVITGPTGTGKTAFIRAVRLLTFNAYGTSYITRGEKTAEVVMSGSEDPDTAWVVNINRGSKNSYHLIDGGLLAGDETFTKLQGKVPEPVTGVLRLGDINFAGQFDRPYLLDSTGGEVARVLGKLTNVTLLYKAAQEANRRRLASSGVLKMRQADLDVLMGQVQQYSTLPAEQAAVIAAEAAMARMHVHQQDRQRLAQLQVDYETAWRRLHAAQQVPPEPPSMDQLERIILKRDRLGSLLGSYDSAANRVDGAYNVLVAADEANHEADLELAAYTDLWGVCALCGQPVRKET